jgi:serine/threonine protein phosphatase PrpC
VIGVQIIAFTASDSFRSAPEDRVAILDVDSGVVVVVADGAGGIPGGGEAADMVVAGVREAVRSGITVLDATTWVRVLQNLDERIERDRQAGETTAVIVAVTEDGEIGASAGDSQAWIVTGDGYDDLTEDQHRKRRLGSGRTVPVAFERPRLDGVLVAGTDGLFG